MKDLDINQLRYLFAEKTVAFELYQDMCKRFGPNENPDMLMHLKEEAIRFAEKYINAANLFNSTYQRK